ncbi:TPA: hypothetical protein ROA45_004020 [Escherichia coli]|nr:hypothetical protein [Escherichia coli]
MTVTHNGKKYTAKKLNDNEWKLTSVSNAQKCPEMASDATLRDYFAAKAMAAIVRRWDGHSFGGGQNSPQYKELADDAYFIADAMLKARE